MIEIRDIACAPTDGTHILGYVTTKGRLRGWMVVRKRLGWQQWSTVPGDYGCEPLRWTPLPTGQSNAALDDQGSKK